MGLGAGDGETFQQMPTRGIPSANQVLVSVEVGGIEQSKTRLSRAISTTQNMKPYITRTQSERQETARLITSNATRAGAKVILVEHGYDVAKINEGKALYNAVVTAVAASAELFGCQKSATEDATTAFKTARGAYQGLAKTCRALFVDDQGALTSLGLNKRMSTKRATFIDAANVLFNADNLTDPMETALEKHSYGSSKYSSERSKVAALEGAVTLQAGCISDYHAAKETERAAVKAMDRWMAMFIKIARVAFAGNRQMLEMFGVVARTGLTKKQREGRKKSGATRAAKKALRKAASWGFRCFRWHGFPRIRSASG